MSGNKRIISYSRYMPSFNLHNYYRSSTSYRVRIALELKQLKYTYTPIHLLNNGGEQNSESYRNLNPIGGVPTLIHDTKILSQSFAIIEYLDDLYPEISPLFSNDLFIQAKIKQVCEIINADIHPLQNLKVLQYLNTNFGMSEIQKTQWLTKWINSGLSAVEKLIEPYAGQYCFGNTISAADLFLVPQLFSAQRFNIDLTKFALLNQINENCLQLEAFKKAHPYHQPDTPPELKNK